MWVSGECDVMIGDVTNGAAAVQALRRAEPESVSKYMDGG